MQTRHSRSAFVLIAVSACAAASAFASEPRPFVLEDVAAFRTIREVRVSPDGKTAALMVRAGDVEANRFRTRLWLAPVDGSGPAPRSRSDRAQGGVPGFTPGGPAPRSRSDRAQGGAPGFTPGAPLRQATSHEASESWPRWSPDGTHLAFLARRSDWTQVWVLPMSGGEARALTSHRESIASFEWSADGRKLLYLAPPPETDDQVRRKKRGEDAYVLGAHWRNHRVWVTGVEGGAAEALTDATVHVRAAAWSPDGRRIALVTTPTPEADSDEDGRARVIDVASRELRDVPGGARGTRPTWSPDGTILAFVRPFDGKGFSRSDLFVWPMAGATSRNVSSTLDRDVEDVRFARDGRTAAILHSRGAKSAIARIDLSSAQVLERWNAAQSFAALDGASEGWVYVPGDRPGELWAAGPRGEAPHRIANVGGDGEAPQLPAIEVMRWKGPAGEIEGVVFKPQGLDPSLRHPLVVIPHGGPRSHVWAELDLHAAYLASLGFVVLKPNFRGSTGYGDAFARANVADWGDGPFADVMAGVDALVEQGLVDTGRLFLYGWSYGGYMANWAVTHTDRFRAVASGAGVADMRMQYTTSDSRRRRFDYFAGSPFEGHLPLYERQSPITYVRQARTPTLFVHGTEDERVPFAHSLMMHRGLADVRVETQMVVYPREGHGFTEPGHVLDRIRRVAEWFRRHDPGDAAATTAGNQR